MPPILRCIRGTSCAHDMVVSLMIHPSTKTGEERSLPRGRFFSSPDDSLLHHVHFGVLILNCVELTKLLSLLDKFNCVVSFLF